MQMRQDSNFWNNWDFKSILEIVLIIVGFTIAYTKLEAKVDGDRALFEKDVAYIKGAIDNLGYEVRSLREEINKKK